MIACLPVYNSPVQSLGQESLLKKKMATHSGILAHGWRKLGELHSIGSQKSKT